MRVALKLSLALIAAAGVVVGGPGLRYAGVLAAVAPGVTIRNGGMEAPYIDGIALPWLNNCWGDAIASFSRDTQNPHSGHSAQHVHCESVTQGAAQIRQVGIAVRAGQVYTLTAWLRGTVPGPVLVGIRQNEAPYQLYVAQHVRVTAQWQRYEISGTAGSDGPSSGIYIAFSVPGDLWVDDVELKEGGPAPEQARITSAQPEKKGNLLYNSSFELGPDGWGPVGRLQVETHDALHGQACARCTPSWQPILLESRPVVIRPGQRYTISASLRASEPAEVELVAMEYADDGSDGGGQRDAIRQSFRIGREWQRVSFSGVLRAPLVNGYILQLNRLSGGRTVWVDAVQWEEGDLTAYQPASPVEVAVRAERQLLLPGQPAVTDCRVYQGPSSGLRGATTGALRVTYRLEDGDGRGVAKQTIRYARQSRPSGASQSELSILDTQLHWTLPRPGIYRVVAAPSSTPIGRTGQAVFCCFAGGIPQNRAARIGIHSWSDPTSPNKAIRAAAYLGAGLFRLHDFRSFIQWSAAEPEPGHFVWFDRDVDDLTQRGYRLIGTLCRTPLWAAQPGSQHHRYDVWSSAPPRDWQVYRRYVEAVVGHYHDRIHEWEVWNEPWGPTFWTGTPEEYLQMLALTRRAIKTADPQGLVVGGCFTPTSPRFTAAVLNGGGLAAMDVVSYHDYLTPARVAEPASSHSSAGGNPPDQPDEPACYQAAVALKEAIHRHGGQQPLWCTETGMPCPSFYSWLPTEGPPCSGQEAVAGLVKGLTLFLAAGVERVYYYDVGMLEGGPGNPSRILNAPTALLDYDGSPKPTLPALAQAIRMLGDAGEAAELSTPALRAYTFRRRGSSGSGYVAVVWGRGSGTPRPLTLAGVTALDAMGAALPSPVTVGDQPIYLLADSREALARAVGAGL